MGRLVMVLSGRTIFMAFLIFFMATGNSQGGRRRFTAQKHFAGGFHSTSIEVDKDKADQAWIKCRKELTAKKVDVDNQALTDLNLALSTKANVKQAAQILPQQRKIYLECLEKQHLLFLGSSTEAHSNGWSAEHVEKLFRPLNRHRRYLTTKQHTSKSHQDIHHPFKSHQALSTTSAGDFAIQLPNSGSAPPDTGPTLAPEPAISPSPETHPPVSPPTLSPRPTPSPRVHKHPHPSSSPPGSYDVSSNDDDHQMEIIIAASITAATTILVVSLLFLCIFKSRNRKVGPGDGQKDERPLLNLRLSNLSAGSSGKSQSIGSSSNNSVHANTGKTPSLLSSMSSKFKRHGSTVAEPSALEATSSMGLGPLKPPPGRVISPSTKPAQPPLPPPPPPPHAPSPAPPPPPKGRPPPFPPKSMPGKHHKRKSNSSDGDSQDGEFGASKAKLKPFFWDKVLADPGHSMVWHELKAGSFQFNEEMMESLFGYAATDKDQKGPKKESTSIEPVQYIQIIDSKKAQNLSIILRALNVTVEEVTDALHEGNELPVELLQTLLKMAPTTEEELKLRLYTGDITQLGPAERFLKVLVEIPFAFKRLEAILFMSSLDEEISGIKESFATLEVASSKLRHSRLFLKLLEAVLKTGNRMNDGTYRGGAQAFKLDTLLKLSDVKGSDGKITLLNFVVQETIRSEGVRAARSDRVSQGDASVKSKDLIEDNTHEKAVYYRNLGLQVVSGLSTELEDVKKAAAIDADSIASTLSKLGSSLKKAKDFLNSELKTSEEESEFCNTLSIFLENAEGTINYLVEEQKRIMALVQSIADYFHGNAGRNEGLRLFAIVRDFLRMLDKACKEVRDTPWEPPQTRQKATQPKPSSPQSRQQSPDIRQRLFPAIVDRRVYDSSSDEESASP